MSEPEPQSYLAGRVRAGRFGAAGASPVALSERRVAIAQVVARKGQAEATRAGVATLLGVTLPEAGHAASHGDVSTVWIALGTWLVIRDRPAGAQLVSDLADALQAVAAVVDQSCGKTMIRVSGSKTREVLAKGCRIDLHPRAFAPGRSAVTPISHVHAVLMQVDAVPTFDLVVPSTLAEDVVEWLCMSAAEFGYVLSA